MNCDGYNEFLALGDEATDEMEKEARQHEQACEECRDVGLGFAEFKKELTDEGDEEDPPEVQAAILKAAAEQSEIRAARRATAERPPSRVRRRLLVAASVAGAAGSFLLGHLTAVEQNAVAIRLHQAQVELNRGENEKAVLDAQAVLGMPNLGLDDKALADSIIERAKPK
jgi:hypothetical protein